MLDVKLDKVLEFEGFVKDQCTPRITSERCDKVFGVDFLAYFSKDTVESFGSQLADQDTVFMSGLLIGIDLGRFITLKEEEDVS